MTKEQAVEEISKIVIKKMNQVSEYYKKEIKLIEKENKTLTNKISQMSNEEFLYERIKQLEKDNNKLRKKIKDLHREEERLIKIIQNLRGVTM